ncbi:hypothetical protein SRABI80_04609 [Peribacillus frigoritolerans]|nr:hypothetical protein SRABI80_04609 [Peribacillus frigoritolerans]
MYITQNICIYHETHLRKQYNPTLTVIFFLFNIIRIKVRELNREKYAILSVEREVWHKKVPTYHILYTRHFTNFKQVNPLDSLYKLPTLHSNCP